MKILNLKKCPKQKRPQLDKVRSDIIKRIDINDKLYPKQLKNIPNPPQTLYLEGNTDLLTNPIISIIGSRTCTENGKILAQKFSYELSQCGITIASGLAMRYRYCCSFKFL